MFQNPIVSEEILLIAAFVVTTYNIRWYPAQAIYWYKSFLNMLSQIIWNHYCIYCVRFFLCCLLNIKIEIKTPKHRGLNGASWDKNLNWNWFFFYIYIHVRALKSFCCSWLEQFKCSYFLYNLNPERWCIVRTIPSLNLFFKSNFKIIFITNNKKKTNGEEVKFDHFIT